MLNNFPALHLLCKSRYCYKLFLNLIINLFLPSSFGGLCVMHNFGSQGLPTLYVEGVPSCFGINCIYHSQYGKGTR